MAGRRLHEFVRALRGEGLRISPVEAEEAFRAATLIGYRQREPFREALALTLVKSQAERADFDLCFDAFFRFEEAAGNKDIAGSKAAVSPVEKPSIEELAAPAAELAAQSAPQLEQTLARAAAGIDFTAM